jgi:UDP-glucose:(heptosyl)LPS alpha-1,3-glucosyltransferase
MRIGLVLDHFDSRRGGVEQWTDQFARKLLRLGHEVHVVATSFGPMTDRVRIAPCADEEAEKVVAGVRPRWIVPHTIPRHRGRFDRARAAEEILQQLDLDIIHDMGFGWYCDILQPHGGSRAAAEERNLALCPAWLRPLKRVVSPLLPRYREFAKLTKRQLRASPGPITLALSQMVFRDMQRLHELPDTRLRLIYNGVDVDRFTPAHRYSHRHSTRARLGLADGDIAFLIVAHNLELKGVPTLIRALGLLRGEGVPAKAVVVGGKRSSAMRKLARWSSVERHVTFVGPVDDPRDFYAASDVYVQPTYYDPCSLVVLEALASGLPVITTRFNGASELLTHGEQGYVLDDPADASSLAELMRQTLNANRRAVMARSARQLALRHTFDDNVRQIVDVYEEVAQLRPAAHRRLPFAA